MSDAALKTPGLYLRALENEPPAPAHTAQTAFVGVTERGPLDDPQIVGSYGDFVAVFGDAWRYGALGDGVYAFFLNGGEEACVVRVARQPPLDAPAVTGCAAKQDLATAVATSALLDANGAATLQLAARNAGSWGNQLAAMATADSARPMDLARLTASAASGAAQLTVDCVYDFRVGGTLRLTHATNLFIKSVHQVAAIDEVARSLTVSPPLPSDYPSGSTLAGPGFKLVVSDDDRLETFDALSVNPAHPNYFVDVINGPANLPYLDLGRQGHSLLMVATQVLGPAGQSRFKPVDSLMPLGFAGGADGLTFATGTLDDPGATPSVVVTALAGGRAGAGVRVTAAPFTGALSLAVPPESGGAKDVLVLDDIRGWAAGDSVTVTSAGNPAIQETAAVLGVDADQHRVSLAAPLANDYPLGSSAAVAARFNLTVAPPPGGAGAPEAFFNLSMTAGPRRLTTLINGAGGSGLVCVSAAPAAAAPPSGTTALDGGSDPDEVPLPAFTGYNADGSLFQPPGASGPVGMAALEAVPSVSLLAAPDIVRRADLATTDRALAEMQLLFHCQKMGERFALLDVPAGLEPADALEWPEHFADPRFARYGALYYPWVNMAMSDGDRLVPPSGVMAGLFAQVDRQGGVGQAPANVQLKGAVGLERDIDAPTQGILNDAGINCVRKFEVGAVRLWGARTLSRDDQYLYVHNRRVVLLAIKGLTSGLRWAVFEPNDEGLQRRVKTAIEGFLRGLLVRNLSGGGRIDDAFFVNVGDDLNDDSTREAGQLVAEIGIAVAKPAEFIVITVKRTPDILTLVEAET
jgi:hypothetical protein